MGAYATAFPGGLPVNAENARRLSGLWGFPVPDRPGLTTPEALDRALQGGLGVLWATGGDFRVVTRRGKQFNSMVHEDQDPLTGAFRDAVYMNPKDAARLGLKPGDPVILENEFGRYGGRVYLAEVKEGTLEVHWPEGNVPLDPKARSPLAHIPAYKEILAHLRRGEAEAAPLLRP